ncbi:hypothetical protein [Pseudophaeobacter sp.]|uniref:hypothetical protein n=1 Tax=Pseudophaeobacter sp. TaxID=1971739 RepID=UPI0032992D13
MSQNLARSLEKSRSRITRNASIALRAERMMSRRRLAVIRSQTGLMAFAGLIGAIGLVMLNVAAFFWLAETQGKAAAGLIVAAANFLLAVLLVLFANRLSVEQELEPVREVRDIAVEEIEAEVDMALDEIGEIAENLRRMSKDPFGSALQSILPQLITLLAKSKK